MIGEASDADRPSARDELEPTEIAPKGALMKTPVRARSAKPLGPMSEDALGLFRALYCRARLREDLWRRAGDKEVGAVGSLILIALLFRERRDDCTTVEQVELCRHVQRIMKMIKKDAPTLDTLETECTHFLQGKGKSGNWLPLGRALLELLLLGSGPEHSSVLGTSILDFFFSTSKHNGPESNDHATEADASRIRFFDPQLRRLYYPVTTAEAVSEMRALAYFTLRSSRRAGLIVRTSGMIRFAQTKYLKKGRVLTRKPVLSWSGKETVACLRAGVRVVYVFPTDDYFADHAGGTENSGDDARSSFHDFRNLVQEGVADDPAALGRLYVLRLDPRLTKPNPEHLRLWAGEFLNRSYRWVFHYLPPQGGGVVDKGDATRTQYLANNGHMGLLLSREPPEQFGASAYGADATEAAEFLEWAQGFLPAGWYPFSE
jgi:hypothetical protein